MARTIIPAREEHIFWIASNMAKADRRECEAAGLGPFRALRGSLERAVVAWTGMVDDEPVCMFGVSPVDILGGVGSPWLLGTDKVRKYAVTFLRLNKGYIARMLEIFTRLENYVDDRNEVSIRWLKWLGFTFDPEPVPYGVWGMPFFKFRMEKGKNGL
jgi:hypothetical protein